MGTYQPAFGRGALLALFGLLTATVVIVVAVDLIEGRGSWGFDAVFVAVLVWNGYWWLLRIASSLSVGPDGVRWVAPLRSGEVAGSDLVSVRSVSWLPGSFVAIRGRTGRSILVISQKGFGDFLSELRAQFPHVDVRVGRMSTLRERLPGRSAWNPASPSDRGAPPDSPCRLTVTRPRLSAGLGLDRSFPRAGGVE